MHIISVGRDPSAPINEREVVGGYRKKAEEDREKRKERGKERLRE